MLKTESTAYGWKTTILSLGSVTGVWLYHQTSAGTQTGQNFYAGSFPANVGTINSASGDRDYWTIFYSDSNGMLWCCDDFQDTNNGPNDNTSLNITIDQSTATVNFNFTDGKDAFTLDCVPFTTLD